MSFRAQQGLLSPLILPSSFPLAVVLPDDSGNLVNPIHARHLSDGMARDSLNHCIDSCHIGDY